MEEIDQLRRDAYLASLTSQEREAFLARKRSEAAARQEGRAARRIAGRLALFGHTGGKGFGFND